jgi:hypothetical protein
MAHSGTYPTADDMRQSLVDRAAHFSALTGTALSRIGREALKDSNFFREVEEGRNFTIGSYEQAMRWFDENWPSQSEETAA